MATTLTSVDLPRTEERLEFSRGVGMGLKYTLPSLERQNHGRLPLYQWPRALRQCAEAALIRVTSHTLQAISTMCPRRFRTAVKHCFLTPDIDLLASYPFSSPNVWNNVVSVYKDKDYPAIFEYGCGISSIHHVRNLLAGRGGSYTAVEHDRSWFANVCTALGQFFLREGHPFAATAECHGAARSEFHLQVSSPANKHVQILLHYRASDGGFKAGEGTAEQFGEYINAVGQSAHDLIVVDGRARKACVHHVLDNDLLKPGGSLALFEAGRGTAEWLGRATCQGAEDYQPAVQRMQKLGATLLDGMGYFSWPIGPKSFGYGKSNPPIPMEACLLSLSNEKS